MANGHGIALAIAILSMLAVCCVGYHAAGDPAPIAIGVDRQNYTPLMSSTVGIGLTPRYARDMDNRTIGFHWHTDYGRFLSWSAQDSKVRPLGPDVTMGDGKVYWSFDAGDMDKEKPLVHITLAVVDRASGRALSTTGLEIGWENNWTATVKKTVR